MIRKLVFFTLVASLAATGCLVSPQVIVGGPEVAATQFVGAGLELIYASEPNLAAILPPDLCPNPVEAKLEDEWGMLESIWLCDNFGLEDMAGATAFEADLAVLAVTAISPLPGDEVLAVMYVGAKRVVIFMITVAAADYVTRGLVQLHTDKEHDPYYAGSIAQAIVQHFIAYWPGGPDDDEWKCYTIRLAGEIVRTVYWQKVAPGASYGDLAWYDHTKGEWGGAYPYKVQETVGNLPKDLKNLGYRIESGCGNPPPFTPAH